MNRRHSENTYKEVYDYWLLTGSSEKLISEKFGIPVNTICYILSVQAKKNIGFPKLIGI